MFVKSCSKLYRQLKNEEENATVHGHRMPLDYTMRVGEPSYDDALSEYYLRPHKHSWRLNAVFLVVAPQRK